MAGEEEGAVYGGTLAFAIVGTQDDKVEGVASTTEVVFLDLWGKAVSMCKGFQRKEWKRTLSQLRLRLLGS